MHGKERNGENFFIKIPRYVCQNIRDDGWPGGYS